MSRYAEWPIAVRTLDLREPVQPITGVQGYSRVRVFVSEGPELLGSMDIWHGGAPDISAARVRASLVDCLGYNLFKRSLTRQLGEAGPRPEALPPDVSVSIVVPTCNRPDDLGRCLASLTTQITQRRLEIIVVDNRPGSSVTRDVVRQFPTVRLIDESRPGLSYARNAGIAAATGDIIIATDDDVTAPTEWLERLVAPFARPEVMAVTGHVLPLELETESQCRFEAYGGLGKGFARFEVDGEWFRTRRVAVPTWNLGATANAAFRAVIFSDPAIGLLDEALGAGMPTGCSEDTYLFYRILKAGHTIVYEPSAYVWHRHRRLMESLRHQIYSYSKGHVAYHLVTLQNDADRRALVRLVYSLPKTYVRRMWERLRRRSDYPLSLILLEVRGNLAGPLALWRSRRRVRRFGPSAPLPRGARVPAAPSAAKAEPQPELPDRVKPEKHDAVSLESTIAQSPSS